MRLVQQYGLVTQSDLPPDPLAVADTFGLIGDVGELNSVGGAWSNRVYRLAVGELEYAVKEMRNPWDISLWREWLDQAWHFERTAIAAGVAAPTPVPNPADGSCLAEVARVGGGHCEIRVHHWVDAEPASLGPATPELARWAGETLATMHRLAITPSDRSVFPFLNIDNALRWPALTDAARAARASWAADAEELTPVIEEIGRLALAAGDGRDEEVMTHGDVDQKNVLIRQGSPMLCDWDVAAPLVPRRELADVALSFGTWEDFRVSREVIGGYRAAGGNLDPITPADLAQPLMIGVDWIVLNIERALRLRPVTEDEAELGSSLVPGLLAHVRRGLDIAAQVETLLQP